MILECYQTLEDRENPDEVERKGPFICSRTDVWLGKGYYLWDTNIQWAHGWGEFYARNGYIICQASIKFDEMILDLAGNVGHMMAFEEVYELLRKRVPNQDASGILVRDVIAALQRTNSIPFNGIRANHEHTYPIRVKFNRDRKEFLIINRPVQICLLNRNNLLSRTFRIVFPEKYVQ